MTSTIGQSIDALCNEQGLDREMVIEAMKDAVKAAARKQFRAQDSIQVEWNSEEGDVEVSVSDLGPGLAGEVEQKIFEPFFTTKPTGTGLGLAISRSIIKAHEARLGYRANQPRGACFYFVLPAHMEMPR